LCPKHFEPLPTSRGIFLETLAQAERLIDTPAPRRIGERAIWAAGVFKHELGVNDPMTHLDQYLDFGEAAMASIDEDFIADCAERLLKPRLINNVWFDRAGSDFVSRENKFSMRAMTSTTEYKFAGNAIDLQLYQRAKIESKEVSRLNNWFDAAQPGEMFIVESMPLGRERYTVVRVYEKVDETQLVENIVTLHNSTIGIFNSLHDWLGAEVPDSQTPLELLDNMYSYRPSPDQNAGSFLQTYVDSYDSILATQNPGLEYSFGLTASERLRQGDDMSMVRSQVALRSIYTDCVRTLGDSGGRVSSELIRFNNNLKFGFNLAENSVISTHLARQFLDSSLQYVVATMNRASASKLQQLALSNDKLAAVESAGYYGGEAASAGERYEGACPTGSAGAATAEAAALGHGYRKEGDPTDCVQCGNCKKVVTPDKEHFERGWWHCPSCKATVPRKGVKQRSLHEQNETGRISALDIIAGWFSASRSETRIEQLVEEQQTTTDELQWQRLQKAIQAEALKLEQLKRSA